MNSPSLVIFDMAGTTIEDRGQVPAAFSATLAANGLSITPEDITGVRGASKRQAIRNLLATRGREDATSRQAFDEAAARIYDEFRRELARTYITGGVSCVAGADVVIKRLKSAGRKVVLTTGFDRDIASLLLSSVGWTRDMIDVIVCGDDVANGRPAPDMIRLAMKLAGESNAGMVANVGDTALDLESAARAGVRWNIGVLSGAHSREMLERAPHTMILGSIAELPF